MNFQELMLHRYREASTADRPKVGRYRKVEDSRLIQTTIMFLEALGFSYGGRLLTNEDFVVELSTS